MICADCGKPVEPVAAALTTKIVSPYATEFRCLKCLATKFGTDVERLLDAAKRYRDGGCVRFRDLDF